MNYVTMLIIRIFIQYQQHDVLMIRLYSDIFIKARLMKTGYWTEFLKDS